jgi:hypothetical protein
MADTNRNVVALSRTQAGRAGSAERKAKTGPAGKGQRKAAPVRKGAPKASTSSAKEPRLTKNARLIAMLTCDEGVDAATLSSALGWQSHTTRAALTRLRQAGHHLEATASPEGGGKRYRISNAPVQNGE